jgi:hypothetical protein
MVWEGPRILSYLRVGTQQEVPRISVSLSSVVFFTVSTLERTNGRFELAASASLTALGRKFRSPSVSEVESELNVRRR